MHQSFSSPAVADRAVLEKISRDKTSDSNGAHPHTGRPLPSLVLMLETRSSVIWTMCMQFQTSHKQLTGKNQLETTAELEVH